MSLGQRKKREAEGTRARVLESAEQLFTNKGLNGTSLGEISRATKAMANELNVVGLMNVQYALKDGQLYVLEVNPRASRTIPFVSKATGLPLAKIAARVMAGKSLAEQGVTRERVPDFYFVKEAVFPFSKLVHMAGVFMSPTRNLASNNRMKHHVNPWNPPQIKPRPYAEYEDEFRDKMKAAGIPVEKE